MVYPKKLQFGGTVGLVAPSSPVSEERAKQCINRIKSMGFQLKCADNLSASKGGYMAGDEETRVSWLHRMFQDPDVDAIFCIRGGDGANRLTEFIDPDVIRNNPKIFVGYSDITSLHLLFNQMCGLVTFHGPMVSSNMVDHFDQISRIKFFEALMGETVYTYSSPEGKPLQVARHGQGEGRLTGGNLTVMCNTIGTPYEIDTDGKILFIEEIGAHIGNMDRNIFQLKHAGKLDHVAGILLGQFTNCRQDEEDYSIVNVVSEATRGLDIPILYHVQSGHEFPMITLPMGAVCQVDTKSLSVRFLIDRGPAIS